MTVTPIAELTPEQFNARFPVGTRVATPLGEQQTAQPAQLFRRGRERVPAVETQENMWYSDQCYPIVTLGSLNVGDEFRWHAETPSAGVYRVESADDDGGCIVMIGSSFKLPFSQASQDRLVQVVALNLAQDDRPEVFPGSMLRDGDVVEFVPSRGCSVDDATRWNRDLAPLTFNGSTLLGREAVQRVDSFSSWHFRLVPATIPAPAPTEPCPAPVDGQDERLASDWRIIMERTPWELVAEIHKRREWDGRDAGLLQVNADVLFQEASCGNAMKPITHLLVVIENDAPQLYSEALNSAAYHAKREELFPAVTTKREPLMCGCGAEVLCSGLRRCGDCTMAKDAASWQGSRDHDPTNRFRGLRDDTPKRELSSAAKRHLNDDCDASGIPEWN